MGRKQTLPTLVYIDNEAARAVAKDPVLSSAMKHVARRHFYAREMQDNGEVSIVRVDTKFNISDILTKALKIDRFLELAAQLRRARVHGGKAMSALRACWSSG